MGPNDIDLYSTLFFDRDSGARFPEALEHWQPLVERLLDAIRQPCTVDGAANVHLSASIGVSRPVPDPRSSTLSGRRSGARRASAAAQIARLSSGIARPAA